MHAARPQRLEQLMRFGIFLAPFHQPDENPTLALQRDLELIEHLDRLGYDEAWIGEHHSAGSEIIASPEIFIATAAERTRHIRPGTGVISLAYHNPPWVAERMVLLDHLTRGSTMTEAGFDALAHHWNVMEERAQTFGTEVDRAKWRLVGLMHIAETREQAYRDVEYGIEQWFRYFQKVAAFPQMAVEGGDLREMIYFVNTA